MHTWRAVFLWGSPMWTTRSDPQAGQTSTLSQSGRRLGSQAVLTKAQRKMTTGRRGSMAGLGGRLRLLA